MTLHQIGYLHLLAEFYTRIIVPPAVVEELERGRAGVAKPVSKAPKTPGRPAYAEGLFVAANALSPPHSTVKTRFPASAR